MNSLPEKLVLVAGFVALSFLAATTAAASCVNQTGTGGCFGSIQAAVDAAGPGETIRINRGVYFENVSIPAGKDGLKLIGSGSRKKVVLDPDAPNSGIGIQVASPNVVIRNLTIVNGEANAVQVDAGGAGSTIERLDIYGPEDDCIEVNGSGVRVLRNRLYGCQFGIDVNAGGTNVEISRNLVRMCDSDCIEVSADGAMVTRNTVMQGEDGHGIEIQGDGFVVKNNRSTYNDSDAFYLRCVSCSVGGIVENNFAQGGIGDDEGFYLNADAPGLVARKNRAQNNQNNGFWVEGTGIVLEKNVARFNGGDQQQDGFLIEGSGHQVIRNTAYFSSNDGFRISFEGSNILLDGNLSVANIGDGIDIEAYGSPVDMVTLRNNRVTNNVGLGIEISFGATNTVVEDNVAKGNRTDYCDEGAGTTATGNNFGTTGDCAIKN